VGGYGIDAFLLLTAARCGPIVSVPVAEPKRHAGSFPHLPDIYHQAVPVLLHLTAAFTPQHGHRSRPAAPYRTAARDIEPDRLRTMLTTLENFGPHPGRYDERPWPQPAANAWHAVNSGLPAPEAARQLWPHYIRCVHDWLTRGQHATPRERAERLAAAHARLHTAVLTPPGAPQ
jgi:hypothetical protein